MAPNLTAPLSHEEFASLQEIGKGPYAGHYPGGTPQAADISRIHRGTTRRPWIDQCGAHAIGGWQMKKRPRDLAKLMIDVASGEVAARANCPENDR